MTTTKAFPIMGQRSRTWTWIAGVTTLVLLLAQLQPSSAVLKENDSCRYNGAPGTCRRKSTCQTEFRGSINICGYTREEAIVCCPDRTGTSEVRFQFPQDDNSSYDNPPDARKSVKMCNEYRKYTYDNVASLGLSLVPIGVISQIPTCDSITKLIVGGTVAKPGEFPHMAAIGWRRDPISFDCGGSLISDQYVLTAAHCRRVIDGVSPSFVRLGDQNLFRQDDGAKPKDVDIERFIAHPEFKRRLGLYNDIALIRLKTAVAFSKFIRPACLYDLFQAPARQAVATGYGLTETAGDKSNELLKAALDIHDNALCNTSLSHDRDFKRGMLPTQLCVGDLEGKRDTCQGDSGGPLQITKQGNHCAFYIFGITSFGQGGCATSLPAVYTRVASYLDWIESIVWE